MSEQLTLDRVVESAIKFEKEKDDVGIGYKPKKGKLYSLMPNEAQSVGQVTYFHVDESATVSLNQLELSDISYIAVAHTPEVLIQSDMPLNYNRGKQQEMTVVVPEAKKGASLLIYGSVPEQEHNHFKTEKEEVITIQKKYEPYEVVLGFKDGSKKDYQNVQNLQIHF